MVLIVIALLIVLAICWIIVPLALIGTKPLLRQRLAETNATNAFLAERLPRLRPPA